VKYDEKTKKKGKQGKREDTLKPNRVTFRRCHPGPSGRRYYIPGGRSGIIYPTMGVPNFIDGHSSITLEFCSHAHSNMFKTHFLHMSRPPPRPRRTCPPASPLPICSVQDKLLHKRYKYCYISIPARSDIRIIVKLLLVSD